MKKIVITGGGTGGHAIPCLAVGEALKNDYEIHFIGSKTGIEKELVKKYPYIIYHEITTCKLIRSLTLKNFTIPFKLFKGFNESKKLLKEILPDVVFSKGGYVSIPVVFASSSLKIPVISHESDLSLGLANRLNLKKSKYMCCSFSTTALKLKNKGIYTGSPIRKQIFKGDKYKIINKYSLDDKPNILILGGSLGSKNLNNIIRNNLSKLCKKYNVFHICGKNNIEYSTFKNYFQFEFVDNIQDFYDAADIVISRAGSNVIFELLALHKPMILIPLEKNSRGDQIENAKYFENKGFAKMLMESNIKNDFVKIIDEVMKTRYRYIGNIKNNKTDAISKIVELLKSFTNQ